MNISSSHWGVLCLALAGLAGCERPPVDSEQTGFRGTGMVQASNPRAAPAPDNLPEPIPAAPPGGPTAGDVYQNVEVLGHLNVAQFTRLMTAMTQWVAPEQGCNYCHLPENLASDDVYTKVVSRRMLQMTQHINSVHAQHVGDTGVTCFTCHRGRNVPEQIWTEDPGPRSVAGDFAGWRDGQNFAAPAAAWSSLPYDVFDRYLASAGESGIRVVPTTALPAGSTAADIKSTEHTYGLMMHLSDALGVNCTYCHNSRSFVDWEQSSPVRVNAWHGINMVQDVNANYLDGLAAALPDERLGPLGDAPKAHCGTCHQGLPLPLGGASMLADYPSLKGAR